MRNVLSGVSVGQNAVHGEDVMFIHFVGAVEGATRLILSRTKGEIEERKFHW